MGRKIDSWFLERKAKFERLLRPEAIVRVFWHLSDYGEIAPYVAGRLPDQEEWLVSGWGFFTRLPGFDFYDSEEDALAERAQQLDIAAEESRREATEIRSDLDRRAAKL